MGAVMVSMTKNTDWECNNYDKLCTGTDICCMYYGVLAAPSGTTSEIAIGTGVLDGLVALGLPSAVGEATMYCADYKTNIASWLAVDGTTYANGVIT